MDDPLDSDQIRLDGRVGVVTGAARGIGRATAVAFARFGMDVAVCDRDEAGSGHPAGGVGKRSEPGWWPRPSMSATSTRWTAFAALVAERFGGVDAVVNNAGGTFRADFLAGRPKGDRALVDENFLSVVNVTRAFVPLMAGRSGAVVNVTSTEAFQAAPGFAVYAAMKAGQESLTKTLALELGQLGIRVNSVSPDGIHTTGDDALGAEVLNDPTFVVPPVPPLGFFAGPEQCASVIVFLVGDMARFVTGCAVHVDGGLHAAGGWHRAPA